MISLVALLVAIVAVYTGAVAINRFRFDSMMARGDLVPEDSPEEHQPAGRIFTTDSLCWAAGVQMQRGVRYRITVSILEGWLDRTERADIGGFPTRTLVHFCAALLRRRWREYWFKPIARIGRVNGEEHVLDSVTPLAPYIYAPPEPVPGPRGEKVPQACADELVRQQPTPAARMTLVAEIRAGRDGDLFLYVNDAVLGIPGKAGTFYRNNRGSARVQVERLPD